MSVPDLQKIETYLLTNEHLQESLPFLKALNFLLGLRLDSPLFAPLAHKYSPPEASIDLPIA